MVWIMAATRDCFDHQPVFSIVNIMSENSDKMPDKQQSFEFSLINILDESLFKLTSLWVSNHSWHSTHSACQKPNF